MKLETKKITQAALMLALLIAVQYISRSFGQFVTGSLVNLVLILTVLLTGNIPAVIIAGISPILAFFAGIGPAFLPIVPFISAANIVYVLFFGLFTKAKEKNTLTKGVFLVGGAVLKLSVLYFGVVKFLLPRLGIPEKAAAAMSVYMSYPQLITALIGGSLAIALYFPITKARKDSRA